ncbi:glycosyltransferase [Rhodobacteraceae bacterium]|nr:glycosyltransferase [Paracoccaceae bacterium]
MKIIVISDFLEGGGAEKFCRLSHEQFRKQGYESTLVCIRGHSQATRKSHEGIKFLNKSNLRNSAIILTILLIKKRPDIILTSIYHINLFILILKLFGLLKNTKFILRHSNNIFERIKLFRFRSMRYFYAALIKRAATTIVSQSNSLREDMILGGLTAENHIVVPNIIDGELSFERIPGSYCVFVGRFEPIKNLLELAKCFDSINQFPKLVMIGDGSEKKKLQQHIKKYGLNIEIQGWSKNAITKIQKAKFLLITSLSEGSPNVVLESLQVNTPVISSDNSQLVRDLCDLGYCNVFKGFNHQDITKGIAQFIETNDCAVFSTPQEQTLFMKQFNPKTICDQLLLSVG